MVSLVSWLEAIAMFVGFMAKCYFSPAMFHDVMVQQLLSCSGTWLLAYMCIMGQLWCSVENPNKHHGRDLVYRHKLPALAAPWRCAKHTCSRRNEAHSHVPFPALSPSQKRAGQKTFGANLTPRAWVVEPLRLGTLFT